MEPLSGLIVLYFLPDRLFKDVRRGSLYERAAAYQHNREVGIRWLPTYLKRWTIISTFTFWVMYVFGKHKDAIMTYIAGVSGVGFAVSAAVLMTLSVAYLMFLRNKT